MNDTAHPSLKEKAQIIFQDTTQAVSRLKEVFKETKTDLVRDATIQRFEFCFELAWKLMASVAQYKGVDVNNPRDAIRTAAKLGLIDDPTQWLKLLEVRNLTAHTYREPIADEAYKQAMALPALVDQLLSTIKIQGILNTETATLTDGTGAGIIHSP